MGTTVTAFFTTVKRTSALPVGTTTGQLPVPKLADYKIRDRKFYVAGMSNGGIITYRLASELSDRIAAIAESLNTLSDVDIQAIDKALDAIEKVAGTPNRRAYSTQH